MISKYYKPDVILYHGVVWCGPIINYIFKVYNNKQTSIIEIVVQHSESRTKQSRSKSSARKTVKRRMLLLLDTGCNGLSSRVVIHVHDASTHHAIAQGFHKRIARFIGYKEYIYNP